ncbi:uncharacterized protein CEXT_756791 [Caerostris extrusa]|uniref:Uncharacterized protein n=1 Tax=Caerostris extrusa TaxID=172846 RepID=A0AAV4YEL9_CAEEX|nr:uncharacterized protein CEXT_756791 [Caerostris extrusa]
MFTKATRFVFMLCGLPVYCAKQTDFAFISWYLWRITIVLRYNVCLIYHTYRLTDSDQYIFELFGLTDVAVGAFVVNSLIGKHKRLIELQRKISEDLNRKCYQVKTTENQKNVCMGNRVFHWYRSVNSYTFVQFDTDL